MASERVEQRVARTAAALDSAGIPYAVAGGIAVRVWVATRDLGATRTTKDIDILVNRSDLGAITQALAGLGFRREDIPTITLFVDPAEPNRKTGIHLVWAAEKVRPSNLHPTPRVDERVRAATEGYWVVSLPALLRMKLTSFRPLDQAHVLDMLGVGLIDDAVRAALPPDLRDRLREIESRQDEWTECSGSEELHRIHPGSIGVPPVRKGLSHRPEADAPRAVTIVFF